MRVALIPLGPLAPGLGLTAAAKVANRAQTQYVFVAWDPVTGLGDPFDEEGRYTATQFDAPLEQKRRDTASSVAIGVVDSPLKEELFSAIDRTNNLIVISCHDIEDILRRTNKTHQAYVLVEVAAQLLAIEYRRQRGESCDPEVCAPPWHKEPRACLFDYCDDRPQTGKKLIAPRLCESCHTLLLNANVDNSAIDACLRIVRRAVRPRILAVAREGARDPFVQILFSGWMITVLLALRLRWWQSVLGACLLVGTLLALHWRRHSRGY
jgi:hypothetical protein